MSNEKHYDYYAVSPEESAEVHALYTSTIEQKRKDVQQELLDQTGAIAWRTSSNWGKPDSICDLVYPRDSELVKGGHLKMTGRDHFDGQPVQCVRGKLNSKAGIAFNKPINEANAKLADLPDFCDWLVHVHYKISRTGLGGPHPGGRGVSMLSTSGGFAGKTEPRRLVFRIPNDQSERHGQVEVPESFEKMTYGAWYDLVNAEGDE